MKLRGLRICRIGGVDVVVDYSWLVIFFLLTYSVAKTFLPEANTGFAIGWAEGYAPSWRWIMGAATAILIFVSVLIHELAHSWVSAKRGIKVTGIRLFIFGGMAETASEPKSGRDEFLIALAGPAVSMFLGVLFVFVYASTMMYMSPVSTIIQWAAMANFALAFFNLAPGFPLDGGRVLRAFLWDRWNDMPRATQVVGSIGGVFSIFLIVFGILQMIVFQNFISGIWFVCIGFLMKQAARGMFQQTATTKPKPPGVTVRQIMKKNAVTVDWLLTVNQFIDDYLYGYLFTEFPVFNRDELVGMVSIAEVKAVPVKLRNFKQIRNIMIPLEQVAVLSPEDDVNGVFERMIETEAECMPVMEEGRFAGIVLHRDIVNYAQIKGGLE